jgi:hypothetical protein
MLYLVHRQSLSKNMLICGMYKKIDTIHSCLFFHTGHVWSYFHMKFFEYTTYNISYLHEFSFF